MLLICISTYSIKAEYIENTIEYSNSFKTVVYSSDTYAKYKEDIESVYVNRTVSTDEGIRKTIVFDLHSKNGHRRQLIYVGDSSDSILLNTLVTYMGNAFTTTNLKNNIETIIHLGERGAAYICFTKVCQASRPGLAGNLACVQTVGLPCTNSSLSKKSISKIACQLSVWTMCNILINRICTSYYELQDVCTF